MTCEFCASSGFISHRVREMMLGLREEFEYVECKSCGCLRIASIPDDLAKYYPSDSYYSYRAPQNLRTRLGRLRLRFAVNNPWISQKMGWSSRLNTLSRIQMFGLDRNMRILDVGSGEASFVRDLRAAGFTGALGLDPYIEQDIHDKNGLVVKKAFLSEIGGGWDQIMFHHSLEHIADQTGTLKIARAKLSSKGTCLVRIPLVNWAWKKYGKDWVQLDPPRHLCVHTGGLRFLGTPVLGQRVVPEKHSAANWAGGTSAAFFICALG
jgi:Methyltransferase domain